MTAANLVLRQTAFGDERKKVTTLFARKIFRGGYGTKFKLSSGADLNGDKPMPIRFLTCYG